MDTKNIEKVENLIRELRISQNFLKNSPRIGKNETFTISTDTSKIELKHIPELANNVLFIQDLKATIYGKIKSHIHFLKAELEKL